MITERKVTTEEGAELAKQLGCPFFEASAKTDHNIKEAFFELVRCSRKIGAKQDEKKKDKKKPGGGFCIIL
jgi:GTPase SAR1 family protein